MSGPRIVLNPAVFHDKRDALCVAMNEAIRVVCEMNGFEPVSEPTEKQRKFFADTAYADDELQLRRTILARIATLDTSVSDPTDEQLEETAEMLEMVMEVGAPQNEWEQQAVQRLHDVVAKAREGRVQNAEEPPPPEDKASVQADVGGAFTPSEVLLPKKPDDLRNAVDRAVEAYRAHAGAHPEDGALLPPVYSDDPEDYRQYVADLAVHAAGTPGAEDVRRRLAAGGSVAYRYLTRPGLRAEDGRSVPTIPENHLLNLPAKFYAGAAAGLSGMARALKAGSSDAVRVVRGPENLGTVMYGGSAADRLADRLEAMSRRFDARVVDAHPALGAVYAAGGLAPWFAARGATVPLMMASAAESGRLDYDRAWMATGENPYDAASWWRTPTARAAGLGAVGMAPWGPWLRQGVQRTRLAAAPVAERAVVPYSPLFAALAEAPGAPSRLAGMADTAAGIGAFTAADLLWPAGGGGKPLPPPR